MITMHIPKGSNPPNMGKELSSAKNIKDKKTRTSTLTGLNKINQYLSNNPQVSGISFYWNDEKLTVVPYKRKTKHYVCGKELLRFTGTPTPIYTIIIIDLNECFCGEVYSDGEIKRRFEIHSEVPNKHKKGGQSADRFARIRENEITLWFKRINEYMKPLKAEKINLGISFVYKSRFLKHLSTYNLNKINRIEKIEYGGLTGVYQYVNKLEEEKGNMYKRY